MRPTIGAVPQQLHQLPGAARSSRITGAALLRLQATQRLSLVSPCLVASVGTSCCEWQGQHCPFWPDSSGLLGGRHAAALAVVQGHHEDGWSHGQQDKPMVLACLRNPVVMLRPAPLINCFVMASLSGAAGNCWPGSCGSHQVLLHASSLPPSDFVLVPTCYRPSFLVRRDDPAVGCFGCVDLSCRSVGHWQGSEGARDHGHSGRRRATALVSRGKGWLVPSHSWHLSGEGAVLRLCFAALP